MVTLVAILVNKGCHVIPPKNDELVVDGPFLSSFFLGFAWHTLILGNIDKMGPPE